MRVKLLIQCNKANPKGVKAILLRLHSQSKRAVLLTLSRQSKTELVVSVKLKGEELNQTSKMSNNEIPKVRKIRTNESRREEVGEQKQFCPVEGCTIPSRTVRNIFVHLAKDHKIR